VNPLLSQKTNTFILQPSHVMQINLLILETMATKCAAAGARLALLATSNHYQEPRLCLFARIYTARDAILAWYML